MEFTRTRISFTRSPLDYSKVQRLVSRLIRNRPAQLRRLRISELTYLNAGCGPNVRTDFVNLDYQWRPGVLCWDLTTTLPFPSDSLAGIYTEHCLEHITMAQCRKALAEFKRVLKPGGTLRVVVPDGELYLNLYHKAQGEVVAFPYQLDGQTPMECVNDVFMRHGHRFIYDYPTLAKLLAESGFSSIQRASFCEGRDPQLLIDSPTRACESLYAEGAA